MIWNRNRLTKKLGINYPIVQGPLGGLSSQKLTAAVSNFGGLGSLGALNLSPEEIKNVISQVRSLTSKPFAVNLWVSMEDDGARSSNEAAFNRSLAPLPSYFAELNAPHPEYKPYSPIKFEDQARMLLDERVPVFALGAEAVEMGKAFLTCEESGARRIHRESLMQRMSEYTGLTKAFTGRLARGINNRLMSELNQKEVEILPYPLQRVLVRDL